MFAWKIRWLSPVFCLLAVADSMATGEVAVRLRRLAEEPGDWPEPGVRKSPSGQRCRSDHWYPAALPGTSTCLHCPLTFFHASLSRVVLLECQHFYFKLWPFTTCRETSWTFIGIYSSLKDTTVFLHPFHFLQLNQTANIYKYSKSPSNKIQQGNVWNTYMRVEMYLRHVK